MRTVRPKVLAYVAIAPGSACITTWSRKRNADRRAKLTGGRVVAIQSCLELDALLVALRRECQVRAVKRSCRVTGPGSWVLPSICYYAFSSIDTRGVASRVGGR